MAIAVTSGFTNYASINRSGSLSGYSWQSAGQAKTNNDFYTWIQGAVAAESGEGYFDYIGGSGLTNNTIPSNATINGLIVRVKRRDLGDPILGASSWNGSAGIAATDNIVQLVHNNAFIGSNKSTGAAWSDTFSFASFGGESDTWSVSGGLTPTILNSSGFGISISPYTKWAGLPTGGPLRVPGGAQDDVVAFLDVEPNASSGGLFHLNIDVVEVTVFYTAPSPQTITEYTIPSAESVPLHRLRALKNLFPGTITSLESIGSQTLKARKNLLPVTINPGESIARQQLRATKNLLPSTITTAESIARQSLVARKSVFPVTINPEETIASQRLYANKNILPVTIQSLESVVRQRLSITKNILPVTISSN